MRGRKRRDSPSPLLEKIDLSHAFDNIKSEILKLVQDDGRVVIPHSFGTVVRDNEDS